MLSPKYLKTKASDSRNSSRSSQKSSRSSKHSLDKNILNRPSSGKILTKSSLNKYPSQHHCTTKTSVKEYNSNLMTKSPTVKRLKPSENNNVIKKVGKETLLERPNVFKKKNQNYERLQNKLKTIESQIDSLKVNISLTDAHIEKVRRSRTKSRESNTTTLRTNNRTSESKEKGINLRSEEPKVMARSHSKVLSSYVTKCKTPTSHKPSNTEMFSPPRQPAISKYYLGSACGSVRQHLSQSITTFQFMSKIYKPSDEEVQHLHVELPLIHKAKKTIVFDLDETLIHCTEMGQQSDIKLPITFPNGEVVKAGINVRPYARQILRNLSKKFQIVVFTASHSCYANVILDWLDPKKELIHHRLFRENCYKTQQGIYVKDLRIFKNRNLDKLILIDNAPYSYFFQMSNGIPILPFYNSQADTELKSLERFILQEIYPSSTTKKVLEGYFQLHQYHQFTDPEKLRASLYS